MSLETALRLTEIALALALIQHSAEHLVQARDRALYLPRIALALCLGLGIAQVWVLVALWLLALVVLHRFDGPYNGGADKMVVLVLTCLTLARLAPDRYWQEMALAFLGLQLVLSYFVSGWVKLRNPDWRSGAALGDVFAFSAYPVNDALRALAGRRRLMVAGSWAVIGLEVLFPVSLLHPGALGLALAAAFVFHLANAVAFGLNRFVWSWLAAYPSLLWFQDRVMG